MISALLIDCILAPIFFVLVTPIAWVARVFGYDPLRLKRNAGASTYWVSRGRLE